jgi:hypothetical protein
MHETGGFYFLFGVAVTINSIEGIEWEVVRDVDSSLIQNYDVDDRRRGVMGVTHLAAETGVD